MRRIIRNNLPIILLAFIALFVCFKNYTPGTILSGWDTLHPEFNFGLALKREVFGVFRSYQGLGAVAAHSDMADLPRIVLLAVFDLFLPRDFLRYSYIFLTLILGPIGMYFFLYKHVLKDKPSSFLGALFYLLNLGTLQQFVVPFEMFVTQYGSLPWLFLFATDYLFYPRCHAEQVLASQTASQINEIPKRVRDDRRILLLFALVTILAAPQAYAATLWYIYFIAFTIFVLAFAIPGIFNKNIYLAKRAFTLILLTLLLNSFWILPNIYYIFTHGSQVANANINKLFSEQAFLYNKEFGNIKDIPLLKSFLFDWNVYALNNHFTQLLSPWTAHLKQPFVESLGFLFAGISFVGIIYSILNPFDKLRVNAERSRSIKRNKILIAFLPLLFLCLFFLFNDNPPTSPLYSLFQERLAFFKEAYRFPQDKVRGVYTFLFAIYFAAGQFSIIRFIGLTKHFKLYKAIKHGQIFIFTLLLFYFILPAFKGYFISPYMRVKIPKYYFEMFSWFNKEGENGRIANLPINSFWGWEYHDWYNETLPSFQGAGFIWFGIKQPVLARDFDRWSPYNEQYYREMSYAIYAQNSEALKLVLEKYNIKYILLDKSVIAPPNASIVLRYQETQDLLGKQEYIQKVKEFGNTLIVYKVKSKTPSSSHYFVQNPFYIYPESQVFYEDQFFKDYGNYIIVKDGIHYPLVSLTDNQSKILPNILELNPEGVVINLPKGPKAITLPSYVDAEDSLPSHLLAEKEEDQLNIIFYPRLPIYHIKDHPIPIVAKSPLPKSENIILSINKKDNFMLNTSSLGSNTPLSLGIINLATKNDNTIAIYPSIPNEEIIPNLLTTNYYIEPCEDIGEQKIFGEELVENNSFNILGKDVLLCMTIPLSEVLQSGIKSQEALLNVAFDYSSNLPLRFCIAKLTNGACQNYKDNGLSTYLSLENKDIQNLGLQFQLDTTNSKTIEKALYSDLYLSLTYPFFSISFSNDMLKKSIAPINKFLSKPSSLILPFSGNKELNADITKFPKTTGYCPNHPSFNTPLIEKQILEENNSAMQNRNHFIRYISEEGSSCDHFSYQNLSQNQAYLIAITSRNIRGLPMTVCVANQVSKHCDIYASLSSSSNFATDIFLLPPQIKNENGFDVNIRNLGIKKTPAVNDLKSIELIPFPYKWLTQIREKSEPNKTTSSLLVLPQSFEAGWKAYNIKVKSQPIRQAQDKKSKVKSFLISSFPFLFGEELKYHVLVNNWANGWVVDLQAMKQLNNEAIVFIFLPQYLEYLGAVFLVGTTVYLALFIKISK